MRGTARLFNRPPIFDRRSLPGLSAAGIRNSVLAALAIAVVGAAVFWFTGRAALPSLDPRFEAELITKVTPLIEAKLTTDWSTRPAEMACAVKPVGTIPADADTITQVQAVYVWASCETLTAQRTAAVLPIGVHLAPVIGFDIPTDADWGTGHVTTLFPERFHDALLLGERPEGLETALKARVQELS
ncbi:hypothetical protein [Actinoplanes derwentensis]|uniref:Uncharacterized protein n=1 Tax=Actinoplanes derwentensis TaxID=113562 RepID=A0A1H1UXH0_9ACTN|nr:hypothetical protein [Actinoplanes derwentensis]GID88903.1 hypothetical protein Ade03nite_78270 [Actinoplanes derwentensis]SDS77040.1 hypothetical protein SAMN04489716_1574 [Actinoplanes derwentensis]